MSRMNPLLALSTLAARAGTNTDTVDDTATDTLADEDVLEIAIRRINSVLHRLFSPTRARAAALAAAGLVLAPAAHAQAPAAPPEDQAPASYWQVKVDFLEPVVNLGAIVRVDYGTGRHLVGLVAGAGGRVSMFDNAQFDQYQDSTTVQGGLEYKFFLRKAKMNRGLYLGADLMVASRTVSSKSSDESVKGIPVVTPGVGFGWLGVFGKGEHFVVDLAILHPRYNFGPIDRVEFETVSVPYKPQNLFAFLGPWSVGWRF